MYCIKNYTNYAKQKKTFLKWILKKKIDHFIGCIGIFEKNRDRLRFSLLNSAVAETYREYNMRKLAPTPSVRMHASLGRARNPLPGDTVCERHCSRPNVFAIQYKSLRPVQRHFRSSKRIRFR